MSYFPSTHSIVSTLNSTTTPLASGATFTGTGELNDWPDVMISISTDQNGTYYLDFSTDGTNWDSTLTYKYEIGYINPPHVLVKGYRYFRVRFTNTSSSAQSYLRLQTAYGKFDQLRSTLNSNIAQNYDAVAVRTLDTTDAVVEGKFQGRVIVQVFGRNPDVDGPEDIWSGGGDYTGFPTLGTPETLTFTSSAGASDAGLVLYIEGLDGDYNRITESVTLNGSGIGVTTQTFWRVNMCMVTTPTSGQVTNVGDITGTHTTTTANVFCVILAGQGLDQSAVYTIPAGWTGYIKQWSSAIQDANTNSAIIAGWERPYNGAELIVRTTSINTSSVNSLSIYGGYVIPEKADIKIRVLSIANTNGDVTSGFAVQLVKNV